MLKVKDKLKLDAEEIKNALMQQTDEYRMDFDKMLTMPNITDERRLASLKFAANACAAILTFLYTKAGIEIRTEGGGLLSHQGYFQAKIWDVERRIKVQKEAGAGKQKPRPVTGSRLGSSRT